MVWSGVLRFALVNSGGGIINLASGTGSDSASNDDIVVTHTRYNINFLA